MVTCAPIRAKQLDCLSLVRRVGTVVMPQYGLLPLIPEIHVIKITNEISIIILAKQIKIHQNDLTRRYVKMQVIYKD